MPAGVYPIKKKARPLWSRLSFLPASCRPVECVDVGLQAVGFLLRQSLVLFLRIVGEQHREHVGDGLALRVAHGIHRGVDAFGDELVLQLVAAAVAPDDPSNLPEVYLIEKVVSLYSYLAHEQLVDVVSGGQFFLPPSVVCLSFGSPFGML